MLRMCSESYQLVLILILTVQITLAFKECVVFQADLFTYSPPLAQLLSYPLF